MHTCEATGRDKGTLVRAVATYLLALAEESWRRGVVSDVSPFWALLNDVPTPLQPDEFYTAL